jgi:hypothetical protein
MSNSTVMILFAAWVFIYLLTLWRERRSQVPAEHRTLRQDWLATGALALTTMAFFWRQLFTTRAWVPAGGGDLASFIYPMLQFTGRRLQEGIIPLWNPYLYGGSPFVADIQSMLFYPVNWVFLLLSREVSYRLVQNMAFLHIFLAGVGMYFCLRHLNRQPLRVSAALTGAIAYMFSGVFLIHLGNLNIIAVAAWLPLVFLFFHRALDRGSAGQAILSGMFLALAALAGHVQIFLLIVLLLASYAVYWIMTLPPRRGKPHDRLSGSSALGAIALLVLTLAITGALSATVFLPSLELAQFTKRTALDYRDASAYSLPPAKLIGMLVPSFFERDPATHWGPWDRVEVGYLGILPLLLVSLALLLRRNRLTLFLMLSSIGALFIALGGYSIVHGWVYALVPGFDRLRAPARVVLLLDFGLAALAAHGLDALLRPLTPSQRQSWRSFLRLSPWLLGATVLLIAPLAYYALFMGQEKDPVIFLRIAQGVNGIMLFLIFLGLSFLLLALRRWRWVRPAALGSLAALLVLIDLGSTGAYLDIGRKAPTQGFEHPEIISFLKEDPEPYRIDSRTDIWHLWQPDAPLLHDIADVWGVVNPLTLADYDRYWENMGSRSSNLYDFLNAKYVIAAKNVELDWDKFVPVFDGDPELNVYLNNNALPRAFTVHQATIVPDQDTAFQVIQSEDFDPSQHVVVEGGRELSGSTSSEEQGAVEVIRYTPNLIELSVDTPQAGYLVLSEVYYPGWQATVDGTTVPIYRANYAFRAVYVEPGTHNVIMTFRPTTWYLGLAAAGITVILLALWGIVAWLRRRPLS